MVDEKVVKNYFSSDEVVDHYSRGTLKVGLWESEKLLFTRYFAKDDRILDMGTGTGRIAFGLFQLGYRYVMGVELSKEMVQRARKIARMYDYSVVFQVGNATALKFEDNLFDQAIFGFNGLMQIPGRSNRIQALKEIRRVIRPGGRFIFTAHDRDHIRWKKFWKQQRKAWNTGTHNPDLIDFGDRLEDTEMGKLYIHVTTTEEMRAERQAAEEASRQLQDRLARLAAAQADAERRMAELESARDDRTDSQDQLRRELEQRRNELARLESENQALKQREQTLLARQMRTEDEIIQMGGEIRISNPDALSPNMRRRNAVYFRQRILGHSGEGPSD